MIGVYAIESFYLNSLGLNHLPSDKVLTISETIHSQNEILSLVLPYFRLEVLHKALSLPLSRNHFESYPPLISSLSCVILFEFHFLGIVS